MLAGRKKQKKNTRRLRRGKGRASPSGRQRPQRTEPWRSGPQSQRRRQAGTWQTPGSAHPSLERTKRTRRHAAGLSGATTVKGDRADAGYPGRLRRPMGARNSLTWHSTADLSRSLLGSQVRDRRGDRWCTKLQRNRYSNMTTGAGERGIELLGIRWACGRKLAPTGPGRRP